MNVFARIARDILRFGSGVKPVWCKWLGMNSPQHKVPSTPTSKLQRNLKLQQVLEFEASLELGGLGFGDFRPDALEEASLQQFPPIDPSGKVSQPI
jgi:hypothetical protein